MSAQLQELIPLRPVRRARSVGYRPPRSVGSLWLTLCEPVLASLEGSTMFHGCWVNMGKLDPSWSIDPSRSEDVSRCFEDVSSTLRYIRATKHVASSPSPSQPILPGSGWSRCGLSGHWAQLQDATGQSLRNHYPGTVSIGCSIDHWSVKLGVPWLAKSGLWHFNTIYNSNCQG